jgi:hypothetical protein
MRANRAKNAHVEMFDQSGEEGADDVVNGVTVHWLKPVFRLDVETIRRRLANCPAKGLKRGNIKVYDLATAAAYLVTPKMDVEALLNQMKPTQLPPNLQPAIWSARLKQQSWEEKAGDLWPTSKIIDVLSEVNRTIRQTIQLWIDDLENEALPAKALAVLANRIDGLQEEIYQQLVALPNRSRTESQLAALESLTRGTDAEDIV